MAVARDRALPTAIGCTTLQTSRALDTCPSIRSTRATSASSKWLGGSALRNLGPRPEFNLQGTPLVINGTLYATGGGGNRRAIVALDAATGELLWKHGLDEGARADAAPRRQSGRGLSYWTDGKGDERILYVTIGYRLVALNAKTGMPISSFGKEGIVDLKVGVMTHATGKPEQIDLETGRDRPALDTNHRG